MFEVSGKAISDYRDEHGCSLLEARRGAIKENLRTVISHARETSYLDDFYHIMETFLELL